MPVPTPLYTCVVQLDILTHTKPKSKTRNTTGQICMVLFEVEYWGPHLRQNKLDKLEKIKWLSINDDFEQCISSTTSKFFTVKLLQLLLASWSC